MSLSRFVLLPTRGFTTDEPHNAAAIETFLTTTLGKVVRINRDGALIQPEEIYFSKRMQNHHGGMILLGDHFRDHPNLPRASSLTVSWYTRAANAGDAAATVDAADSANP